MGGRRHCEANYSHMHKLCCCTLHVHFIVLPFACTCTWYAYIMYSTANVCGFQILRDPWQTQSVWACSTGGVSCPEGKLVLGILCVKCFSTLLCSFTACRTIWTALRQVQVENMAMGMQQLNSPLVIIGECCPYHSIAYPCMLGYRQAVQTLLSCDRKLCLYDCKVPIWMKNLPETAHLPKMPAVLAFSGHKLSDSQMPSSFSPKWLLTLNS